MLGMADYREVSPEAAASRIDDGRPRQFLVSGESPLVMVEMRWGLSFKEAAELVRGLFGHEVKGIWGESDGKKLIPVQREVAEIERMTNDEYERALGIGAIVLYETIESGDRPRFKRVRIEK